MRRRSSRSTLLPYTTLFRSRAVAAGGGLRAVRDPLRGEHRAPVVELAVARPVDPSAFGSGDAAARRPARYAGGGQRDRKSTRLNSSHLGISYAVFCLKQKKE